MRKSVYYAGSKLRKMPGQYRQLEKENGKMRWEFILALVIAVPVILFPAAYVWYLNVSGIYVLLREAISRRLARNESALLREASFKKLALNEPASIKEPRYREASPK